MENPASITRHLERAIRLARIQIALGVVVVVINLVLLWLHSG